MPFLAYLRPNELPEVGAKFIERFTATFRRPPTFVAFEGYDSILALASAMAAAGSTDRERICDGLRQVRFDGSRGRVAFSTSADPVVHQQWRWPPVVVAGYDGADGPTQPFTTLWDAERGWTGVTP